MDWKDVGRTVAKAAPILGSVLGGPIGAIAGAAGSLLASALGVDDSPDAIADHLANHPDALLRLKELEIQEQGMLLRWKEKQLEAEIDNERELTKRHRADMASDSWLSKNVRPLCLLIFTAAVVGGTFVSSVPSAKLKFLTDLGYGIYGYYFVGRSAFDKGAVKLNLGGK